MRHESCRRHFAFQEGESDEIRKLEKVRAPRVFEKGIFNEPINNYVPVGRSIGPGSESTRNLIEDVESADNLYDLVFLALIEDDNGMASKASHRGLNSICQTLDCYFMCSLMTSPTSDVDHNIENDQWQANDMVKDFLIDLPANWLRQHPLRDAVIYFSHERVSM